MPQIWFSLSRNRRPPAGDFARPPVRRHTSADFTVLIRENRRNWRYRTTGAGENRRMCGRILSWRVIAARVPRMTTANSPCALPKTGQQAVFLHGEDEVLAARRAKPAHGRHQGTEKSLIPTHEQNREQPRQPPYESQQPQDCDSFPEAGADWRSRRRSSFFVSLRNDDW